jgi:hypothetical protein
MTEKQKQDRNRQWAKLSSRPYSKPLVRPLRMRDIPGILDVEDKILLYSNTRGEPDFATRDQVAALCKQVFGIDQKETEFQFPPGFFELEETDPESWKVWNQYHEHEAPFETSKLNPQEQVIRLRELGLDFSAENGQPLRCLPYFARAAEAAAKRMKSYNTKLPTQDEVSVSAFENKLAAEAEAFLKSKSKR